MKTKEERNTYMREYVKEYRKNNPEKVLLWRKKSWARNGDKYREQRKAYSKEYRASGRRRELENLQRYSLTSEEFQSLWEKQNGLCAICETSLELKRGKYAVDHDHLTNKVRGILCAPCNFGLGGLKDSPQLLLKALHYLESS